MELTEAERAFMSTAMTTAFPNNAEKWNARVGKDVVDKLDDNTKFKLVKVAQWRVFGAKMQSAGLSAAPGVFNDPELLLMMEDVLRKNGVTKERRLISSPTSEALAGTIRAIVVEELLYDAESSSPLGKAIKTRTDRWRRDNNKTEMESPPRAISDRIRQEVLSDNRLMVQTVKEIDRDFGLVPPGPTQREDTIVKPPPGGGTGKQKSAER
jgi:hypothetical protein